MEKCGLHIHVEKINLNHYLIHKNFKEIIDLDVQPKMCFFFKSEESIGESLQSCDGKKKKKKS